ncbi:MAG: alcohol dehydrogenase catalytic domain-containing protein, partial [Candidatus Dormibacteraeota bacterium]|nr:alcohol dehydrogenase catalytic domain-containing protein [Candidatus Dormibacteraeota bacterium]
MRAQRIESLDGPAGLRPAEVNEPDPDGKVLIEVAAAGVSFPDLLLSRGLYQMKPPLPFIPGVEVAGIVRSAPGGTGFQPGDRVMAFTVLGGFAEVAAAGPARTVSIPDQLDFEAAGG